jgi:hypothetical protein
LHAASTDGTEVVVETHIAARRVVVMARSLVAERAVDEHEVWRILFRRDLARGGDTNENALR